MGATMKTRLISFAFGLSMAFVLMTLAACGKDSSPAGDTDTPADSAAPASAQSTPVPPAPAQEPAAQEAADGTLTIDLEKQQKPWTGDLDGMIERRVIRVLTVNSKTFYFHDKGTQRGTVVDFSRLFEDELNKKLAAERNSRTRT